MAEPKTEYRKHIKEGTPLKYAVLPFEGDKIYDYIKKNMRRQIWTINRQTWKKYQDKVKKNIT